ncbi:glycosyltransferase [Paenibacillus elgii]
MKIVHINNTDLPGSRFNGHDLQIDLNKNGHEAYQLVAEKLGNDANTIDFSEPFYTGNRQAYMNFEKRLSMHGVIYPYGRKIMKLPQFQQADVVHYHLIHNYIISLLDFSEMVSAKPSVWTLHDPWVFTGHCIYPMECEKWRTGCHTCPHLDTTFPMQEDKAFQIWNIKKNVFPKLDVDIVVASKYMMNLVKQSPLMESFERVHLIPFGLRLQNFMTSSKNESRKEFGIPEDHFVITFRADKSKFKGLPYILEMLERLKPSKPVTLLTVGQKGLLNKFKTKYNIIDLDWVTDDNLMANIYAACDVFLMPSTAEAFGLMAIETMASSRPIVVFDGTSLADVTFAPQCGVLVKQGDSNGLCEAVERLMNNPEECERRGALGRKLAEEHYSYDKYFNKLLKLYDDVITRRRNEK